MRERLYNTETVDVQALAIYVHLNRILAGKTGVPFNITDSIGQIEMQMSQGNRIAELCREFISGLWEWSCV